MKALFTSSACSAECDLTPVSSTTLALPSLRLGWVIGLNPWYYLVPPVPQPLFETYADATAYVKACRSNPMFAPVCADAWAHEVEWDPTLAVRWCRARNVSSPWVNNKQGWRSLVFGVDVTPRAGAFSTKMGCHLTGTHNKV